MAMSAQTGNMQRFFLTLFALCVVLSGCSQAGPAPYPGWQRFSSQDYSIWLPGTFRGGSLSLDKNGTIQRIDNIGLSFSEWANAIQADPSPYDFVAADTIVGNSGRITNVIIAKETLNPNDSLSDYLDRLAQAVPQPAKVMEEKVETIGTREVGRMVLEAGTQNLQSIQTMYIVNENGQIWRILFSTPANEYNQRKAAFEQSVGTFKLEQHQAVNWTPYITLALVLIAAGALLVFVRRRREGQS